jgi:hypothetical protein
MKVIIELNEEGFYVTSEPISDMNVVLGTLRQAIIAMEEEWREHLRGAGRDPNEHKSKMRFY